MDDFSRTQFLLNLGKLSALTALAGCSGGALSNLPDITKSRRHTSSYGTYGTMSYTTSSGRIITTTYTSSGITVTCTDTNGLNPQTMLTVTADGSTGLLTFNAYHYGQYQINAVNYANGSGSTVSAYGHTITPTTTWGASVGQASITGTVVKSGYAKHDIPTSTMYGDDQGYASSVYHPITYGGGNGCPPSGCPLVPTTGSSGSANATMHAVLAGIGFAAGLAALVFFGPEMGVAELVLVGTGTISDEIDFFKEVFNL